jgi:hypothetical protein
MEYCPERKAWRSRREQAERTQGAMRLEELQKIVAGFSKERFLGQQLIEENLSRRGHLLLYDKVKLLLWKRAAAIDNHLRRQRHLAQ